jgi:hypothetical protein
MPDEVLCAKSEEAAIAAMTPQKIMPTQVSFFMFDSRQTHPTEVYPIIKTTLG